MKNNVKKYFCNNILSLTLILCCFLSNDINCSEINKIISTDYNSTNTENTDKTSNSPLVWIPVPKEKWDQLIQMMPNISSIPLLDSLPFINNNKENGTTSRMMDSLGWPFEMLTNLARALPLKNNLQTVCYDDLGCYSTSDYLHIFDRPIALMPMSPEQIDIQFNLFTCDNKYRPVLFGYKPEDEAIIKSPFDPRKKTKFIIHGFRDYYDDMYWMGDMKDYILRRSCNYNVFCVDWSKGSRLTNYLLAVANCRLVGAMIAHFIERLGNVTNATPKDMELIGHSLGAHIAGYAGSRFDYPKVAKILGLDPAGPAFQTDEAELRLDRSDADLVVIIHTDAGTVMSEGFGIEAALGHIDFFPNNGLKQIGCELTRGVSNFLLKGAEGIVDTVNCNHRRATLLPISEPSLFNTCQLIAYECESYEKFSEGECADCGSNEEKCRPINLDTNYWDYIEHIGRDDTEERIDDHFSRQMFLQTSDMFPFCLYHYQIVVYTSDNSTLTTGSIKISLFGEKRDKLGVKLAQMLNRFKPKQRYTYLLTYPKELGLVMSAELFWSFSGIDQLNPMFMVKRPGIKIRRIDINFMSHSNPRVRRTFSSKLCPIIGYREISDGESARFQICNRFDRENKLLVD